MNDAQRLEVRVDANTARFDAGMRRTRSNFDRESRRIEGRARQLDRRLATTGSRFGQGFSRQGRATLGNVGQQIQDIAVQAEQGTNSLRIFAQQGPQIAGAFGPLGAVFGAFIAVAATAGSVLFSVGDEAEGAALSVDSLRDSASALQSGLSGLESAARAYADAIEATSTGQTAASANIVAQTEREFEAKKRLLELEVKRQQALAAERKLFEQNLEKDAETFRPPNVEDFVSGTISNIEKAQGPLSDDARAETEARLRQRFNDRLANSDELKERVAIFEDVQDDLKQLRAEGELAAIALERAEEALDLSFGDLATRSSSGGRGSTSRRADTDFVELGRKRIKALEAEKAQIGLVGVELERLQARQQAARLERELLAKAQSDGSAATDEERAQIVALKAEYLLLADSVITAKDAEEKRAEALKEAEKRTRDAERATERLSAKIMQGVADANSFSDAVKRLALNLADAALQEVLSGALSGGGGFFSSSGAGGNFLSGLFGSFADGGAFSGGRVTAFARGGVVGSPTTFPMRGGLGLMGEAGPEAIMPLKRGADGRLGVEAAGGGAPTVVQHLHIGPGVTPDAVAAIKAEILPEAAGVAIAAVADARARGGTIGRALR